MEFWNHVKHQTSWKNDSSPGKLAIYTILRVTDIVCPQNVQPHGAWLSTFLTLYTEVT